MVIRTAEASARPRRHTARFSLEQLSRSVPEKLWPSIKETGVSCGKLPNHDKCLAPRRWLGKSCSSEAPTQGFMLMTLQPGAKSGVRSEIQCLADCRSLPRACLSDRLIVTCTLFLFRPPLLPPRP